MQKNVRTLEYSKEKDGTQQRGKRHLYSKIREPVQLAYLLLLRTSFYIINAN